jgi:hypothetical protein
LDYGWRCDLASEVDGENGETMSAALGCVDLLAHNPAENTDGAFKQIVAQSVASAQGLADGSVANPTDAASAYFVPPYANNVFLLMPGTCNTSGPSPNFFSL